MQIFLRYHNFMRGVVFRCYPHPGMVEDVVQQVYVELLARKNDLDLSTDIRPFLTVMTENVAHAQWRKRRHLIPENLQKIAEHVRLMADDRMEDNYDEKLIALQYCLGELPEKSRELVHMHYFDDIKMHRIAEQLGHKANTISRALGRLRHRLGDCIKKRLVKENDHVF